MTLNVPEGTPDRGPGVVTLAIILIILTTIATAIRIASKFVASQQWWWDDFFAVLSFIFELITLSFTFPWRAIGLGYHSATIAAINPVYLTRGSRYLYVATLFFDGSVTIPKLSAAFFYARAFGTQDPVFTFHLYTISALTWGWLIASWISTIFQCIPIAMVWDHTIQDGTCITQYPWYLSTAILSTIIDLYILILPIPKIWALNAPLKRRIWLLIAFCLAYSVIVLSIGRIVCVARVLPRMYEDLTWEMPVYLYWAFLEGSVSIISISVPSGISMAKVLFRRGARSGKPAFGYRETDPLRRGGLACNSSTADITGKAGNECGFTPGVEVKVSGRDGRADDKWGVPLGDIHVRTDVTVR
ncbi:hypothetical protein BDV12DRAFT_208419 [Aspergillus spectabilis]